MSLILWAFQLCAAGLLLFLDLAFRISVYITVIPGAFGRYVLGVKPKPKPKLSEDELDLDRDFVELAESRGFTVQEHTVEISDGYLLTLHRILPKNYKPEYQGNYEALHQGPPLAGKSSEKQAYFKVPCKGVVFFQHGFLQCSEVWLFRKSNEQILPFLLSEQGYDCWFGNVRGNKYSLKHKTRSPLGDSFWNFCIDDLAQKDVPEMLQYVLNSTGQEKLSYVGFSQGTAIAFAAFSRYPELAAKINVFVALGPAACVKELRNQLVAAVSTSRPQFIFALFGKKALLDTAIFWRKVVPTQIFVKIIDTALDFLFGWKTANMDHKEKALMYYHLYSTSSVKCVVHWFQITHSGRFQMFDDNIVVVNRSHRYKGYLLPKYDIRMIQCPISIFYGGRDTVPNHDFFLQSFKGNEKVEFFELPSYEHLDFLYAKNAKKDVYDDVIRIVNKNNNDKARK